MKMFFQSTGAETEWNAAYYRLEDYFRALHLVNKVQQSQIILRLLQAAAVKHGQNPGQNPTTLAMEEAYAAMDGWLEEIFQRHERVAGAGLVSLLITDAAEKWPTAFMADEIPADFQQAMQESDVRAGPDLQVSSMVPRPIDPGPLLEAMLPERWEKLGRGALVTTCLAVIAILALILFFVRL
jgi:hypothetical protein